jgi:hypothetical protein
MDEEAKIDSVPETSSPETVLSEPVQTGVVQTDGFGTYHN